MEDAGCLLLVLELDDKFDSSNDIVRTVSCVETLQGLFLLFSFNVSFFVFLERDWGLWKLFLGAVNLAINYIHKKILK